MLASLSHGQLGLVLWLHPILPLYSVSYKYFVKILFVSFTFSRMADCAFCASTLLAHAKTCSLVTLSFLLFCELLYHFYTHVTVIQPMYKLLFQLPIDFLVVILLWLF